MFVLRKIEKETKRQSNFCLGKNYSFIHKGNSIDSFNGCLSIMDWMTNSAKEMCYAVISDEDGYLIPLFEESDNYIMSESGKTFSKV